MVGRCIPYWNSPFIGDMLVFGGVMIEFFLPHPDACTVLDTLLGTNISSPSRYVRWVADFPNFPEFGKICDHSPGIQGIMNINHQVFFV